MKQLFGLLLLLFGLFAVGMGIYHFAQDETPRRTGDAVYDQGQAIGKAAVPVVGVISGLLGLALMMSDNAPSKPPPRRTAVTGMPQRADPSLRGGQNTFASNPARLQLSAGRWLAANPWVPAVAASMGVIGVIALFIKVPVGVVLLVAAGIFVSRELGRAKQKLLMGDVCPGVVLSAQDNLVAVFTDLVAAGNVPRPAIKILKQPLQRMTGEPAYDGMRVAAAALYHGDARLPAWQDFLPEVINCVVADPDETARVLGSISEPDWQALDTYLSQIAEARPGLYRMWQADVAAGRQTVVSSGRPWFQTPSAKVLGITVVIVVVLGAVGPVFRAVLHRTPGGMQFSAPPPMSQPGRPAFPSDSMQPPGQAAAYTYTVGASVEAFWFGKWTPGKVVSLNSGGFSMMVQVEDSRFPQPILLATNQVRPK